MKYSIYIFLLVSLSVAGVHDHGQVSYFVPEVYADPTFISFSNGIRFDTKSGEPFLPDQLKIDRYDSDVFGYYLVQVNGPVINSWTQEITNTGGKIVGYIPNYTLMVRANKMAIEKIQHKSFVRWVGIYQPAYKLAAELLSVSGEARVSIQVFPDEDVRVLANKVENLGFSVDNIIDHPLAKSFEAIIELNHLGDVAKIPGVLWIQLWSEAKPANDDSQWVCQTGWRSSVPGSAGWRIWNEGIRGDGLVLCTSDTGIRTTHVVYYDSGIPINSSGVYPNHRKIVAYKVYQGASFGDNGSTYHGTHVSCTVAGDDSINGGNDPYDGISKDARIYFLDLANSSGSFMIGQNLTAMHDSIYLGRGLPYTIQQHSASWRWWDIGSGDYRLQDATTDAYCWEYKDYLNIWAAGNEGNSGYRTIGHPALAKNVLTIGATNNGTSSNSKASFSSRGPAQDGRIKPNVMAPGVNLMSANGAGDNGYKPLSGTSMATPSANGAIGLIRQYLLAGFYPTGAEDPADSIKYQSAALLRSMAMVSADPNVGSYVVPDSNIGWGRIDVDSVLYFVGDLRRLIIKDNTVGIGTGQAIVDSFEVFSSIPLRVCMAWTDTAAAPGANPTLVNDLNLELIAPDGTFYRGNQYSGGQSQSNPSTWDNRNVEECCRINSPQTGVWRITVSGQQVVYGPQPFAYSITGNIGPAIGILEGKHHQIHNFSCRLLGSVTNGNIALELALPRKVEIAIGLLDITGRRVENIYTGKLSSGKKIINHKSNLPNGLYFVEIKAEDYYQVEKVLILK